MATTTNFGWTTPDDTGLVKDGASAIRTLGSAIDTSFLDLKGGTTGQNLRKNSNTDLDFTWAGDATNTVIDAEGDLLVGDSADTLQRLAIGTTGQVLTVDTTIDGKIKWAAAAAGKNYSLINTGGTALTGATTVTISNIGGYDDLVILVDDGSSASDYSVFTVRFNSDSGTNYAHGGFMAIYDSTYSSTTTLYGTGGYSATSFPFGKLSTNGLIIDGSLRVQGANSTTGFKAISGAIGAQGTDGRANIYHGIWKNTAAITSVSFISSIGNWDGGTAYVFGA